MKTLNFFFPNGQKRVFSKRFKKQFFRGETEIILSTFRRRSHVFFSQIALYLFSKKKDSSFREDSSFCLNDVAKYFHLYQKTCSDFCGSFKLEHPVLTLDAEANYHTSRRWCSKGNYFIRVTHD